MSRFSYCIGEYVTRKLTGKYKTLTSEKLHYSYNKYVHILVFNHQPFRARSHKGLGRRMLKDLRRKVPCGRFRMIPKKPVPWESLTNGRWTRRQRLPPRSFFITSLVTSYEDDVSPFLLGLSKYFLPGAF
jgi:hypothetical protein